MSDSPHPEDDNPDAIVIIQEPLLWCDELWTAKVIKNEEDEGWAVAMTRRGESEPALVAPWTMGRDKKNPKPLSANAFHTWVKTASEVIRRHEQQLHDQLHKSLLLRSEGGRLSITLDIVPDDDDPHAWLAATDELGESLARVRVAPSFKLTPSSAQAWVDAEFQKPR